MVEFNSDSALQRIGAALARLEASVPRINQAQKLPAGTGTGDAPGANEALLALQTRHEALRETVRLGLGQLDGVLAELASIPGAQGRV